jgi:hypothetical protein
MYHSISDGVCAKLYLCCISARVLPLPTPAPALIPINTGANTMASLALRAYTGTRPQWRRALRELDEVGGTDEDKLTKGEKHVKAWLTESMKRCLIHTCACYAELLCD